MNYCPHFTTPSYRFHAFLLQRQFGSEGADLDSKDPRVTIGKGDRPELCAILSVTVHLL